MQGLIVKALKKLDSRDCIKYKTNKILFVLFIERGDPMRLTRAGEYAVRCVFYLSKQEPDVVIRRSEIAREMGIPDPFLGKIAQQLSRAGIIEIVQGAKGGLRLLRAPNELNLLEVVEAIMGEITLNDCILNPDSCSRATICAVHTVWQKAKTQLRQTLGEANFYELIRSESTQECIVAEKRQHK